MRAITLSLTREQVATVVRALNLSLLLLEVEGDDDGADTVEAVIRYAERLMEEER